MAWAGLRVRARVLPLCWPLAVSSPNIARACPAPARSWAMTARCHSGTASGWTSSTWCVISQLFSRFLLCQFCFGVAFYVRVHMCSAVMGWGHGALLLQHELGGVLLLGRGAGHVAAVGASVGLPGVRGKQRVRLRLPADDTRRPRPAAHAAPGDQQVLW